MKQVVLTERLMNYYRNVNNLEDEEVRCKKCGKRFYVGDRIFRSKCRPRHGWNNINNNNNRRKPVFRGYCEECYKTLYL